MLLIYTGMATRVYACRLVPVQTRSPSLHVCEGSAGYETETHTDVTMAARTQLKGWLQFVNADKSTFLMLPASTGHCPGHVPI